MCITFSSVEGTTAWAVPVSAPDEKSKLALAPSSFAGATAASKKLCAVAISLPGRYRAGQHCAVERDLQLRAAVDGARIVDRHAGGAEHRHRGKREQHRHIAAITAAEGTQQTGKHRRLRSEVLMIQI